MLAVDDSQRLLPMLCTGLGPLGYMSASRRCPKAKGATQPRVAPFMQQSVANLERLRGYSYGPHHPLEFVGNAD